ncbi:MAG: CinA family protein [Ghiorsea sp.]
MSNPKSNHELAELLIKHLQEKGWFIRCVESCTAGAITATIGQISGASTVLDRSWVTYSNQAKHEEVGVPLATLETYGAVSKQVVSAMAEGAVKDCEHNTVSISVSGIAGPNGGTADKPVGTVWLGIKIPNQTTHTQCFLFEGDRNSIQQQAINSALKAAINNLQV